MGKILAVACLVTLMYVIPAYALTLDAGIEKTEAPEEPRLMQRSNVEGRIGIRVSSWGTIHYVHPHSPAEEVGLLKGDKVLTVDGKKNAISHISGIPGTTVHLSVRRRFDTFIVDIMRVEYTSIY